MADALTVGRELISGIEEQMQSRQVPVVRTAAFPGDSFEPRRSRRYRQAIASMHLQGVLPGRLLELHMSWHCCQKQMSSRADVSHTLG